MISFFGALMPPRILVIEAHATRLRREGLLDPIDVFEGQLAEHIEAGELVVTRFGVDSEKDLTSGRNMAEWGRLRYDAIVLAGHGGPEGLEVTPDAGIAWADVATYLAPLEPRVLLSISCFGSSSAACEALFEGVTTLDTILGSPTKLRARDAQLALVELLAEAGGVAIDPQLSLLSTALTALSSRGIVFRRTRAGFSSATPGERLMVDLIAEFARIVLAEDPVPRRRKLLPPQRRRAVPAKRVRPARSPAKRK